MIHPEKLRNTFLLDANSTFVFQDNESAEVSSREALNKDFTKQTIVLSKISPLTKAEDFVQDNFSSANSNNSTSQIMLEAHIISPLKWAASKQLRESLVNHSSEFDIFVDWLHVQTDAAREDKILAQFLLHLRQQFEVRSQDDQAELLLSL